MPELPEVETIARQLRPLMQGCFIEDLQICDKLIGPLPHRLLRGARIKEIVREGKYVVLAVETVTKKQRAIAIHLRMTGRLLWVPRTKSGRENDLERHLATLKDPFLRAIRGQKKHIRVLLWCDRGVLVFIDPRRFGTWKVVNDTTDIRGSGLDPSRAEFTKQAFGRLFAEQKQPIKNFLLRQDKVVGLGNIYVSEALFLAGVRPSRATGSLTEQELGRLFNSIRSVIRRAIEHCGTTFSDYQDSRGSAGQFQRFLKVYDREGEACRRCQQPVVRFVQAGRSSFFCRSCQK